ARGVGRAAHLISRTRQRLGQHGADRTVVVRNQYGRRAHLFSRWRLGGLSIALSSGEVIRQHRQVKPEVGAPGSTVYFDKAAVIAHDLGDEGEPKPATRGFGGHE